MVGDVEVGVFLNYLEFAAEVPSFFLLVIYDGNQHGVGFTPCVLWKLNVFFHALAESCCCAVWESCSVRDDQICICTSI